MGHDFAPEGRMLANTWQGGLSRTCALEGLRTYQQILRKPTNYTGRPRTTLARKPLFFRALRTFENNGERGNGAQGRNRTSDTVIFSHVLYQLSYLGFQEPCALASIQNWTEAPSRRDTCIRSARGKSSEKSA